MYSKKIFAKRNFFSVNLDFKNLLKNINPKCTNTIEITIPIKVYLNEKFLYPK